MPEEIFRHREPEVVNSEKPEKGVSVPVKSRTEGSLQRERFFGCQSPTRTNVPQPSFCGRSTESPREIPDALRIEVIDVDLKSRLCFVILLRHGVESDKDEREASRTFPSRNRRHLNNCCQFRTSRGFPRQKANLAGRPSPAMKDENRCSVNAKGGLRFVVGCRMLGDRITRALDS